MHMMFNFFVNQHVFYAFATADARPLAQALQATRRIPEYAQWASFLRNHDELDLGRLTEERRQAVYAKFAPVFFIQLYRPASSTLFPSTTLYPALSNTADMSRR